MEAKYEDLLKRARMNLPKQTFEERRFEMPQFNSFNQGNKTIIKNFTDVCRTLGRDPQHLIKYLLGEVGAPGELSGHRLTLKARKDEAFLNSKLNDYAKKFVFCEQCKKPDTELRKESGVLVIKCKACSAKYTVRKN